MICDFQLKTIVPLPDRTCHPRAFDFATQVHPVSSNTFNSNFPKKQRNNFFFSFAPSTALNIPTQCQLVCPSVSKLCRLYRHSLDLGTSPGK